MEVKIVIRMAMEEFYCSVSDNDNLDLLQFFTNANGKISQYPVSIRYINVKLQIFQWKNCYGELTESIQTLRGGMKDKRLHRHYFTQAISFCFYDFFTR